VALANIRIIVSRRGGTFRFHKIIGISYVTEQLFAAKEELCTMDLVTVKREHITRKSVTNVTVC
jgi:hypothetical protein